MACFTNQARLAWRNTTAFSNVVIGEVTPAVRIEKCAIAAGYRHGDTIVYTVSLTNSGTVCMNDLTVTDTLGAYEYDFRMLQPLDYVEGSLRCYVNGSLQEAPAVSHCGDGLIISPITLPAGGNIVLVYAARVNDYAPPCTGGCIENTVRLTGACMCGDLCATDTLCAARGTALTLNKMMTPAALCSGEEVTCTLMIVNNGCDAVVATDDVIISDVFNPALHITEVTFNGEAWTRGIHYTYDEATGAFATLNGRITVPACTCTQDSATGAWHINAGVSTLVIKGMM